MNKITIRFRDINRDMFYFIKSGEKTVETRAATDKYRNIKAGDILVCVCGNDKIEKTVKKVSWFKSIPELLKHYDLKIIMPDVISEDDAIKQWLSFPKYKEKIEKFGIVAFEI